MEVMEGMEVRAWYGGKGHGKYSMLKMLVTPLSSY